ncbi:MAG: UDP-3-O-[3-hydroxymyristoyl] N-acetylglucosamine deacetylase [Proteobacteria bacterium]|nr:UDP-3-O-[3-hydroxymyristoyl] N-acetylglucosamine deacetylase [Pseudomonadota bacterium]
MFEPFIKEGIGLHTGCQSRVLVEMGPSDSGVVFVSNGREIPARPGFVSSSQERATALVLEESRVATVEHLLAALAAFGETDVRVIVDGEEIPILDGSALPWAMALKDAGAQVGPCFVGIIDEVEVRMGDSAARITPLEPDGNPSVHVVVDFERPELERREITHCPLDDDFTNEVAPARTFAFASEIEQIRSAGLARGGSLESALVIGADGPINPEGQRFDDEPVRHKLLDALGDLFLLGGLPWAEVSLVRPGHRLLHELTRRAERLRIISRNSELRALP